MCLTIDIPNPEPSIAKQDIDCYKVLKKLPNRDILNAPLYDFEYCFGVIYITNENYFECIDICDDGECFVEYGFHSFVKLSDAVRFKWHLMEATR